MSTLQQPQPIRSTQSSDNKLPARGLSTTTADPGESADREHATVCPASEVPPCQTLSYVAFNHERKVGEGGRSDSR